MLLPPHLRHAVLLAVLLLIVLTVWRQGGVALGAWLGRQLR